MSANDFVKFYSEYLPKNPELKQQIDDIPDQAAFLSALVENGKKAGFNFGPSDVHQVMSASVEHVGAAELSEHALDAVVGGAGTMATTPTVSLTTIRSVQGLGAGGGKYANTTMCPGWTIPGGTAGSL